MNRKLIGILICMLFILTNFSVMGTIGKNQVQQKHEYVKLDDSELKIATSVETEAEVGKTIWLEFRPEDIHVFDKETEDTLTKKLEGKE